MDKMHPQLIDTLKAFLDYNARVDGVSFRNAIFIFLSNAGGNEIAKVALDFRREGKDREEIKMNSKELETKISQSIMSGKSGFSQSILIDHHLIDHFIPFLPLEQKHVSQCAMAEMVHLKIKPNIDLANEVAQELLYSSKEEKIYADKGCNLEHTKPTVGRRAVFVRRPTEFSQCVPHRRLKLVLVCFFRPIRHVESELVGQSGHLISLIGCSATATCWYGKAFHLTQAQNRCATWPSGVERWFGLEADLNESLFGQHIVSYVVLKAVSSFMTDKNPNKPLVLSFHGTAGVGKNHVAKIIARNVYKKGENSKHIHTFISEHHFPHKEKSDLYSSQLKQWIHGNVSSFPRSMFIFDEMDKINPQLIDVIKPFLDYNARVDGVSFRNAIFIFLSNAGGRLIAEVALDFWREGNDREELWMNSKELETKISQNIFNDKGGFLHSSIIDHHLIDHYIPFLPLELKHVRQCVLAEMVHLNMKRDNDLGDKVAREMPYYPEEEKIFAVKGCKSVRQKLALYNDE
ncbi:Torsin-1B [Anabarilius grahami]|uniref:Torsin-1B n=1 Tax=Anabarilius grahami TaxID=495550 RepID=A0A3N0Z1H6_ANAGA|nr:Torsin-1B [Anabarilius grahami]